MPGSGKKASRLSSWTATPPVPHEHVALWRTLCQKPVLARLGLVLAATLMLTVLAYGWGMPLPYRIGERWAHDVRSRLDFFYIDQGKTDDQRDEALKQLSPAERDDPAARERARQSVRPVVVVVKKNEVLIQGGEPITEDQRNLMREETRAFQGSMRSERKALRMLALFLLMSLMALVVVLYVVRYQLKLAQDTKQIVKVCVLMVLTQFLWQLLARPPWHAGLVPLTVNALVLAIAFRPPFALLVTFCFSTALTASRGNNMDHLLVQIGGQALAVLLVRNVRTRTQLVRVGAVAGIGYVVMTVATALLTQQLPNLTVADTGRRFLWALLAGFIVTGALPLIEHCFGVITDIRLLELADASHPLLQEMVRRAPGTYNHSMNVANLAEQAAEAVGANGLLARVGSYFHDIGKMLKPSYFIENQNGQNLHDTLEPGLSTLIIIGHVKDGVELARQYRLPTRVIDFIQEHHGTTLVEYFYRAALRQQEELGHAPSHGEGTPCSLESSFRYPGPKPQSPESGIVMLTDCIESASRALSEPTPGSLRKLVRDLTMKRLLDGQLEESGLTLTELHIVEESLVKGLIAVYHSRIKYPEGRDRRAG
jgi:putative nucleotidyltransferase with HDIG domain